jgi:hydrogenase expression/formation protein HypE
MMNSVFYRNHSIKTLKDYLCQYSNNKDGKIPNMVHFLCNRYQLNTFHLLGGGDKEMNTKTNSKKTVYQTALEHGFSRRYHDRVNSFSFKEGDAVIVTGSIGDHGIAVLAARGDLGIHVPIESDCASLNHMLGKVYEYSTGVRIVRDPIRGGLVTTLVEIAEDFSLEIVIKEERIPVKPEVHGMCDLVGFDPLYLANEGKAILIVADEEKNKILSILGEFPEGQSSVIIGTVTGIEKGRLLLETPLGSKRLLTRLTGTMLPRIC